ncbi:MAG: hypothetical protein Q9170_008073, partial [Blastenia crenularia]
YRDRRAKAVAPLYAAQRLRAKSAGEGVIGGCVAEFVEKLGRCKEERVRTDILDLCARFSIDVLTGYLLGEKYGGLNEFESDVLREWRREKLSANPFIFAIVAFSRFSLLPNWLFGKVYSFSTWVARNEEVVKSFGLLDRFITTVMGPALEDKGSSSSSGPASGSTYQSHLLQAGIDPTEAAAQSKAIVFAGADSTAVILVTALFHIIRNPSVRKRLEEEMDTSGEKGVEQAGDLPYLRGTIKETLRLGMANPTPLTRVVPPGAELQADGVRIPEATVVGCAAYTLHHDPEVFPDPFSFRPERWLAEDPIPAGTNISMEKLGLRRPNMDKSLLAFGAGARACLGKALAMKQLEESLKAVVESGVLEGARTCEESIEVVEWFNGEIRRHRVEVEWV